MKLTGQYMRLDGAADWQQHIRWHTPGRRAVEHISGLKRGEYPALMPAFAAAYQVGRIVVEESVAHWDKYADTIPTSH